MADENVMTNSHFATWRFKRVIVPAFFGDAFSFSLKGMRVRSYFRHVALNIRSFKAFSLGCDIFPVVRALVLERTRWIYFEIRSLSSMGLDTERL